MAIKLSQKEISLDLQHQGFTNTIYVQEGDVDSRELTISLFDDGEEYIISSSSKVYLSGERSDKAVVSREVDSFTNNIIKVIFRNEEICAKGISKYKIIIKDADDVLSSVYFKIKVYENVYDENGILATPQYSELQEAIKKADSIDDSVKSVKDSLNSEISRAKSAEKTNSDAISSETARATAKENEIANNLSSHTTNTSNPHSVTKAQVGLGNVEDKSSATIRGEITKSNITTALGYAPLNQSLKGSADGLAELDSNGKVPSSQLPSYVDDVIEGYLSGGKFYKESAHTTEISGETGKIYIDLSTEKTYRWSGSTFVVISETLALGETSSTAYRGDRGKTAYDHSQTAHAPSNAQANVIETVKVNGTALTPSSKAVDITVPTKVSELTDGSDYAKTTDIPTTLPANGGNADTVNNHTVKSDVPENAVFTDTIYDDTEVQKRISDNGYGEVAGGKNLLNHNIIKIGNCSVLFKNDTFYATNKGSFSSFVLSVQTIVGKSYTVTIKDWSDYSYRCIASVSDLSDNSLVSMVITDATLSMTFTAVDTESLIHISPNNTPNELSNTITFKCMLREGSVATEYEPYFPSNKMLAEEKADKSETTVNLLKPTLGTITQNGVTCTNNGDGTYTLNGTYDNSKSYMAFDLATITLNAGNYNVIGNKEKTSIYGVLVYTTSYQVIASTEENNKNEFSLSDETKLYVKILVRKNSTFQNEVFKPMITTNLNATYDDFVPYTGSTGQINSDVAEVRKDFDEHTHSYAGSSSSGGSATSAVKLDSSAGSAKQPVYFSDGKPVACNFIYEEGTWSPEVGYRIPVSVYSFENGKYTRIGNIVHCSLTINMTGDTSEAIYVDTNSLPFSISSGVFMGGQIHYGTNNVIYQLHHIFPISSFESAEMITISPNAPTHYVTFTYRIA